MKKILIIGPLFYGYSKSVAKAFRKENYEVDVFDEWVEGGVEGFKEKIAYNFSKDKNEFFEKKYVQFNSRVLKRYDSFKPDMVFIIRGAILSRETLLHMKDSVLALWMMDSIFRVGNTLNNIKLFDHVFLFEKEDLALLKEKYDVDAHFLPLALDETVYYPIPSKERPIDILFVGNLYDSRITLLNKIIERFPHINFKIYGYYFSKLRNLKRYFLRKDKGFYVNAIVQPDELNVLYSQTKICLNIHHSQSVYGVNQRFFEISGAAALQVCDHHGFIEDNFKNSEILLYRTDEELFSIIGSVLQNFDKHRPTATKAYTEVLKNHTFHSRIKFLMEKINS